jgi:hypothetical protein
MNLKIIYTSAALLFLGFLLVNNSSGRASVANEGNTGAPGDEAPAGRTCQSCHNSTAIQVNLDLEVTDLEGNAVTSYIPGNTYNVQVAINAVTGSPSAYGFQLVSERNSDNQSINSFSNPSSNAKLATINATGRQYAEHSSPSSSNTFTVQWTAPEAGTGAVTFYSAGNGVNSNSQSSGDGANKTSLMLSEEAGSSVFETPRSLPLSLAPNPVRESVAVTIPAAFQGPFQLRVADLQGRILKQETGLAYGNSFTPNLFVGDLTPGTYFLQAISGSQVATARFIKY